MPAHPPPAIYYSAEDLGKFGCGNIYNGHLVGKLCPGQKDEAQAIREAGPPPGSICTAGRNADGVVYMYYCHSWVKWEVDYVNRQHLGIILRYSGK